jgi:hypothetical protein
VLATDGLEDPLPDEVVAELGQRPPSVRQAELRGGLVRDPNDGSTLVRSQARRGAAPVDRFNDGESIPVKGVQDRVHGIGVQREAGGDLHGVPTVGVEEEDLSPALLGWRRIVGFKHLLEVTDLSRAGLTDGQGARHGGTSPDAEEEVP